MHAAQQVHTQVVPVVAPVNSVVGDLLRKQLAKVVKPPTSDLWSDADPDTYLLAMDRFVDVSGASGNDIHLLRVVWLTLPDHVRTVVATPDVSASFVVAGPWTGLDAFTSWNALRAAIVEHFRPLSQDKHLHALLHLRIRKGNARKYREDFLHHLSRLDSAYRPSDNLLLRTLQAAQYPRLARMPNVVLFEGRTRWLPSNWHVLLNAMIDSDSAIADDPDAPAPGGGSAGPAADNQSGGSGTAASKHHRRRAAKRARKSAGASEGGAAAPGVVAKPTKVSSKPTGKALDGSAGVPVKRTRWIFSNPLVVDRQKQGLCLACGSKEHRKAQCTVQHPKEFYAGEQKNV